MRNAVRASGSVAGEVVVEHGLHLLDGLEPIGEKCPEVVDACLDPRFSSTQK